MPQFQMPWHDPSLASHGGLPITNRRYSRLGICATLPHCIRRKALLICGILLLLAGCSTAPPRHAAATPQKIEPYMRVVTTNGGSVEVQLALRKFVPAHGRGPAIWLVSASHLGETNYYERLQQQLDAQTLVLYEGVRDRNERAREPQVKAAKSSKAPWDRKQVAELSPLQVNMARSMGLVFQLEAIDYEQPNFQNSDLSFAQLRQLLEKAHEPSGDTSSGASKQFEDLIEAMNGDSLLAGVMNFVFKVIGSDPKFQAMAKLALIETFQQVGGDFSRMQGLPAGLKDLLRVIIEERNKQVLLDLKSSAKKLSKHDSIAIFYGAGHMTDLERRVTAELKYRPADEVWLTAFSVNPRAVGLSDEETAMVRSLIKWQMNLLK